MPCFLFFPKHISTSLVFLRSARHGFAFLPRWVPGLCPQVTRRPPPSACWPQPPLQGPADAAGAPSRIAPELSPDSEAAINRQINLELYASYRVLVTGLLLLPRDDVALHNFARYFLRLSREEPSTRRSWWGCRTSGRTDLPAGRQEPDQNDWKVGWIRWSVLCSWKRMWTSRCWNCTLWHQKKVTPICAIS